MAAIDDQIAIGSERAGTDENGSVIRSRIFFSAEIYDIGSPVHRQMWQRLCNPGIAAGITKKNQVFVTHIGFGDIGIVFNWKITAHVASPFIFEAAQTGGCPGIHF